MATSVRRSTCNRDCPDACGLLAEVEDGKVVALRGDPGHPVTRGFLCFRTSRYPELQDAPQRLRRPLLRVDGALVEVGFEHALDVAAERLSTIRSESGPAAIFHYRSGGSLGLLKTVADRFFEQLGPCTVKIGDICNGAGEAAQVLDFGVSESNDLLDLLEARHVILWGKNPTISSVHLVPILREARARGARITLIDPVAHRTRGLADEVLQPRPGGDLALAFGIAAELLDRGAIDPAVAERCHGFEAFSGLARRRSVTAWAALADVPQAALQRVAAQLAEGPTAIQVGWGMQRRRFGGAIVRALDALSAVSGNLYRSGGGCSFYFGRRSAFATDLIATGAAARTIREPLFVADVAAAQDPPIRAIWVTAGNPVCMLPDSAAVAAVLERTEFVVVADSFLTDTARRADLVLPVPTLLEDSVLIGSYGHHWLGESRPIVDPPPGVPHEVEIFAALGARLGFGDAMAGDVDDWKRRLLSRVAARGVTLEALREGAQRNPDAKRLLFGDGRVQTPDGRVRLLDDVPDEAFADTPDDGWPLWLFSNSSADSQAAQWAREPGAQLPVRVHPDCAPPGCRDGDVVVVESRLGAMSARLRVDPAQRRDVAIVPKGGHFDRGASANSLIEAQPTDLGLGAAYLDCRVRLRAP